MMMLTKYLGFGALLLVPVFVRAATFRELVDEQIVPLGDAIVALLFALAFLFFLFGMLRFFITTNDEDRAKGKSFALWGIVGLVVLFGVWGFVRLLLSILPGTGV